MTNASNVLSQDFDRQSTRVGRSPHWLEEGKLREAVCRAADRQRRGLHHLIVIQRVDGIPGLEIPVVYLSAAGAEEAVPVAALSRYLEAHSARSRTWMMQPARTLGMLHDYIVQRGEELERLARKSDLSLARVTMSQFRNHLVHGTMDGVEDRTGLFWERQPTAERSINLLRGFQHYIDWLDEGDSGKQLSVTDENDPIPTARRAMTLAFIARRRRNYDFLVHLASLPSAQVRRRPKISREIVGKSTRGFDIGRAVRLPERLLMPLLKYGFKRRGRVARPTDGEDVTCKLASMICAFGGVRPSEALHIWVSDVNRADGKPIVFMHHPAASQVQVGHGHSVTRLEHLRRTYGMMPRHLDRGRLWAGWKGMALNSDHAGVVFWLPLPGVPELFWDTFMHYSTEVRPKLMVARRRRGLGDHPWLLVSNGSSNENGTTARHGDPYTMTAFRHGWSRAIRRLRAELEDLSIIEAKHLGTTVYGLRHNYGGMLADAGLTEREIQLAMRHISPESQKAYTTPLVRAVHESLTRAEARTRERGQDLLRNGTALERHQ